MQEQEADRIRRLAGDWAVIWQSELAARGADPETGDTVRAMFEAWLRAADGAARLWPLARDAGADAPAGAAPADVAPGARDGELALLRRRLDELERRMGGDGTASVDGQPGVGGQPGPDGQPRRAIPRREKPRTA